MKKYLGISAIALGMVVASLPVMPAAAQSANAATISKDFGCGGFVPTATGGFGSFLVSFEGTQSVINSAGVTSLVCHFDIPAGSCTHSGGLAHMGNGKLFLSDTRQLFLIDVEKALASGTSAAPNMKVSRGTSMKVGPVRRLSAVRMHSAASPYASARAAVRASAS